MIIMIIDHDNRHHDHRDDDEPVMAGGVVPLSINDRHARLLSLGKKLLLCILILIIDIHGQIIIVMILITRINIMIS